MQHFCLTSILNYRHVSLLQVSHSPARCLTLTRAFSRFIRLVPCCHSVINCDRFIFRRSELHTHITQVLLLFLSDVFMLNRCSLNTHTQVNCRFYQALHGSQCDPELLSVFTPLQQGRFLNSSTIEVLSFGILSLSVIKNLSLLLVFSFPTVSNGTSYKCVGEYPIMQCTLLYLQV